MKILFSSILFLALALPLSAQTTESTGSTTSETTKQAPGPGRALPQNASIPDVNFSELQSKAFALAEKLREPASDLFTLLAILALIWAGYQAQFQGLQEFVGTLMRIIITSALIVQFKDMITAILNARHSFITDILASTLNLGEKFEWLLSSMGVSAGLMSFSGIAIWIAVILLVALCALVFLMQILFEAVLIAFGPLAIATLAFRNTQGIFSMWLKTFVAVVLIPVGWTLGASLFELFLGKEEITSALAGLLFSAGAGAVYLGMPYITLSVVNAAGGAAGQAMPSLIQAGSSLMNRATGGKGGGGGGGSSSGTMQLSMSSRGSDGTMSSVSMNVPSNATPPQMAAYNDRIAKAHAAQKQTFHP